MDNESKRCARCGFPEDADIHKLDADNLGFLRAGVHEFQEETTETKAEWEARVKASVAWEGSREQAEFIDEQYAAVLDVLIAADAWTSHDPWRGKTAAQQVKIFIDRAAELDSVIKELRDADVWDDESPEKTTPALQVFVLHQKLIECGDDLRSWERRYEAALKSLRIITRHRRELEKELEQLRANMIQPVQAGKEKEPLPLPRVPIRPLAHNSSNKIDVKHEIENLRETVDDLVLAVNDLQRWAAGA